MWALAKGPATAEQRQTDMQGTCDIVSGASPRVEEANLALCLVLAGVCHFVPSAGMDGDGDGVGRWRKKVGSRDRKRTMTIFFLFDARGTEH